MRWLRDREAGAEVVVGSGLGFAGLESPAHKEDRSDPAEIGMRKAGKQERKLSFPAFLPSSFNLRRSKKKTTEPLARNHKQNDAANLCNP